MKLIYCFVDKRKYRFKPLLWFHHELQIFYFYFLEIYGFLSLFVFLKKKCNIVVDLLTNEYSTIGFFFFFIFF